MELALEKRQVKCCVRQGSQRIRCEAMQEMIVPDACQDIALVMGASGDVMVESKSLAQGRLTVGGKTAVRVLYAGDGGKLESLSLSIPYRAEWDSSRISSESKVRLTPWLESVTIRELNPRKILARVNIVIDAEIYSPEQVEFCTGAEKDQGLFMKKGISECPVVLSLEEKEITVSDRLELPTLRPSAKSLLRSSVRLVSGESKTVGGKIIFKGGAAVDICYMSDADCPERVSFELPFSQIIECSCDEAQQCSVNMYLGDMEVSLSPDREGRSFGVDLTVVVQALCCTVQETEYLEDLFSTAGEIACKTENIVMGGPGRGSKKTVAVREVIETGPAASVCDVIVSLAPCAAGDEEIAGEGDISVIFTDESGSFAGARRSVKISAGAPEAQGDTYTVALAGEVGCRPVSGGIEVSFEVNFICTREEEVNFTAVTCAEFTPDDRPAEKPGVVLCRCSGGSLWQLCRKHRADPAMAAKLNGVDGDRLPSDGFLLIPIEG